MSPYVYAVYWLPPASSAFLLARKCNWLAEKMLITCVMRHARLQKLQRFRRKMPFYSFLILCLDHLFIPALKRFFSFAFHTQANMVYKYAHNFTNYFLSLWDDERRRVELKYKKTFVMVMGRTMLSDMRILILLWQWQIVLIYKENKSVKGLVNVQ